MKRGLGTFARNLLVGAIAIGILAAGGQAAKAASVEQLEAAMRSMQAQMKALQDEVAKAKAAAAAASASAAAASGGGGGPLDLKVKWKGAPELSSSDGKFKFKVRGRLNVDGYSIDQDEPITGVPDVENVELRRARIGVEGVLFYDLGYKFEVDFAGDVTAVKDAYLSYTGLEWFDIVVGNFKHYNSLDVMMSANYITFMERGAYAEAFTLDRLIGLGLERKEKYWTASAGVFSSTPTGQQLDFFEDGTTFAARVTAAPINNEKSTLHLGASVRQRDAANEPRDGVTNPLFRYRARGADFHAAERFVDTGNIGEEDTFWGLEGAIVYGPFSVQGEYTQNKVEIPVAIANVDPTYTGWYADASFFLTGERRPYSDGVFQRVKVKNPIYGGSGGWGAWQIAGRYDVLDLSDKANAIAAAGVVNCAECGEQKTWLIGVNWYLNDYTRIMLNVNHSELDGGVNDGADIEGVGTRFQIDW
jgi:phosphate-selective porin OprO and OprP